MASLDCISILTTNAVVFKDEPTTMQIGQDFVPKDGYSDSLRLLSYVKSGVQPECASSIVMPGLTGQKWDEESFESPYLFRRDFELYYTKPMTASDPIPSSQLTIWNGSYLRDIETYETDEAYMDVPIPQSAPYYYNMAIKRKDAQAFLNCQTNSRVWAVLPCSEACERFGHVHVVSGRYLHRWQMVSDGEEMTVDLAPPIFLAVKREKGLQVTKNCILGQVTAATKKFEKTLVSAGSKKPEETTSFDDDFAGEQCRQLNIVYTSAYAASKALVEQGSYADLQAIIRNAGNIPWRQLDKVVPTNNSARNLKRSLGTTFSSKILPLIQKTGGTPLKGVIIACTKIAAQHGSIRDVVLGYLMSRLAEPMQNISEMDGSLVIMRGGMESEFGADEWADY